MAAGRTPEACPPCSHSAGLRVACWAGARAAQIAHNIILNCICSAASLKCHRGSCWPLPLLLLSVQIEAGGKWGGFWQARHKPYKNVWFSGCVCCRQVAALLSPPAGGCLAFGDAVPQIPTPGTEVTLLLNRVLPPNWCMFIKPREGPCPQNLLPWLIPTQFPIAVARLVPRDTRCPQLDAPRPQTQPGPVGRPVVLRPARFRGSRAASPGSLPVLPHHRAGGFC